MAGVLGLARRIATRIERIKRDPSHPWVGLGIVRELEEIMQLLTLPEFAEWLRLHGGEHAKWADEILELHAETEGLEDATAEAEGNAADATEKLEAVTEAIKEHIPYHLQYDGENVSLSPDYVVERAGNMLADIRVVLVERGALSVDDRETELPDLIAALLS